MTALIPYKVPQWAECLTYKPSYRFQLGNHNTPIQRWNLQNVPDGIQISIKRDDTTDSILCGNKSRKLEFVLADAVSKGFNHVITCGQGLQSNQCRALAFGARQLGLIPHIMLAVDDKTNENSCEGNMLLNKLAGANIYTTKVAAVGDGIIPSEKMEDIAKDIKQRTGENSYIIPPGSSDKTGLFGYLSAFEEMISQGLMERFDDIVVPIGSTGTATGLAVANYLTGSKLRVHAIRVASSPEKVEERINTVLFEVGLNDIRIEDILNIIEGYCGEGYSLATEEELEFILEVSKMTGILLDTSYTAKAALGMVKELHKNPQQFKGKRILFIHTGGMFSLFNGCIDSMLTHTVKHV